MLLFFPNTAIALFFPSPMCSMYSSYLYCLFRWCLCFHGVFVYIDIMRGKKVQHTQTPHVQLLGIFSFCVKTRSKIDYFLATQQIGTCIFTRSVCNTHLQQNTSKFSDLDGLFAIPDTNRRTMTNGVGFSVQCSFAVYILIYQYRGINDVII